MNQKYWEEYYKNEQPTDFAKFCLKYIPKYSRIIDVGCGNGRDTKYFKSLDYPTLGMDYASSDCLKMSLKELTGIENTYTIVYSRFFLHCISKKEIVELIKWSKKSIFMAEFRAKGDKPKLFKDHKRNFISLTWLLKKLEENGFKIIYHTKKKGLAKYKGEDPLVGRVIAKSVSI